MIYMYMYMYIHCTCIYNIIYTYTILVHVHVQCPYTPVHVRVSPLCLKWPVEGVFCTCSCTFDMYMYMYLYIVRVLVHFTCACIYIHACTMHGRVKGTDSSINSIVRTVGILYRTGGEFIEPEAVRKRIRMPSRALYDRFSCYKPVKTLSLVQYGNCRTRSVVSMAIKHSAAPRALSRLDHAPRSTIPILHSRRCFN